MMTEAEHGLDPTPEITAADNRGAANLPATQTAPVQGNGQADPTQGGKTLPIGGADGGQADTYKPQGLPEHLVGQSDRETIDRLNNAYKGARDELAKGKPVIPNAGEYQFNWSDSVKAHGGIAADDEAVQAFAAIAHEHGYTQQQIDAIPKFFDKLVEKGVIEPPFDSAKLLTDLAPAGYKGTPEEKQAKGGERLASAEAWIKQLDPQTHGFDDAMKQELRLLTTSGPGVKVIEALMKSGMNPSVSPGGGTTAPAITKADLDARVADKRNDAMNEKFDPAFADETRRLFRQLYPD